VWKGVGVGGCLWGGGERACICALLCWMHGKLMDNGMCGLCLS
jgi:hypothetical protein